MNANFGFTKGLEGVIAAESKICLVDGEKGKLFYRGHEINNIINNENLNYEEAAILLLYGKLESVDQIESFKSNLKKYRQFNPRIFDIIKDFSRDTHPMKVMQACTAALGGIWDNKEGDDSCGSYLAYISQFPIIIAAYWRFLNNKKIIEPNPELSFSANFLYMLFGKLPSKEYVDAFDKTLILHMEHGFNASTFTARVIASSMATVSSSLSGALGSLSGVLHGSANERVLMMLDEIGSKENIKSYIDNIVGHKGKVMGMGHRVYSVKDPRAIILQKLLDSVQINDPVVLERYEILKEVENYFSGLMKEKNKQVYPNVDFYSGTLLSLLGIDPLLYTPIFAMARVVGWCAHVKEQWKENRIFRPKCHYVGESNLHLEELDIGLTNLTNTKKKVLVIDDDSDIIDSIQIPLEANNFIVHASDYMDNLLDLIVKERPDLILLGDSYSENNIAGFDVCYSLKEHEETKHIPLVMLSAICKKFCTPSIPIEGEKQCMTVKMAPVDGMLQKPLCPDELLTTVNELMV